MRAYLLIQDLFWGCWKLDLVQASGPPHISHLHSLASKAFLPIFCYPVSTLQGLRQVPLALKLSIQKKHFSLFIFTVHSFPSLPSIWVNLFGLLLVVCMPVYCQDESLSYPHTHLWSVNVYTNTLFDKMKGRSRAAWKPEYLRLDGGIRW